MPVKKTKGHILMQRLDGLFPRLSTMVTKYRYDGSADAEYILEKIMHRQRWLSEDRDKLAEKLELLVNTQHARITQNEEAMREAKQRK